jgi:hypothetical protein
MRLAWRVGLGSFGHFLFSTFAGWRRLMQNQDQFAEHVARASACRVETRLDARRCEITSIDKRRDESRRGRHECPRHENQLAAERLRDFVAS